MIYILVLGIPFIRPIGIPLQISEGTRDMYNALEALKPGDVVLYAWTIDLSAWSELGPGMVAIAAHILSKPDVKLIMVGELATPLCYERIIDTIRNTISKDLFGKEYGKDYCILMTAGGESGMKAFMTDIRGAISYDFYLNSLDDLPVMEGVRDGKDFTIAFTAITSAYQPHIRQIVDLCNVPLGALMMGAVAFGAMPYYKAGVLFSVMAGLGSCAEYELLTYKGPAITRMDSLSLSAVMVVILMIAANIKFYSTKVSVKVESDKDG